MTISPIFIKDVSGLTFTVAQNKTPFVIAEMSGNHNHSIERAFEMIEAASKAGAHAVKFQTYTADTITLDHDSEEFQIKDKNSLWSGETLYKLYEKAHTPWDWHKRLFNKVRECGMIPFSSPFDHTAVDFLESECEPALYKIASFECTDIPLVRKVASLGKPMLISTGMASLGELDETVRAAREAGCPDIILLKCTSQYPAQPKDANIATIPHMRDAFGVHVGLSDHTMGIGVAVAAAAIGAVVIEKHFTLRRADGGVDSAFSLEPEEIKALVEETERSSVCLGHVSYGPSSENEKKSLQFRRSLYVVEPMKKGDVFTQSNIRSIRPSNGLETKYLDIVLGKVAKHDLPKGTPLSFDHIA